MAKKLKKSLVTQKNELSEGRADWTILMARSYVRIMDIFTQRYKAFKSSNPNDVDMFGKSNYKAMLEYDISRTSMAVIGKDGKPNTPTVLEFKSAFSRLADVGIVEGRPDDKLSWSKINIIGGVKYDATYDTIHCDMSPMMLDYLCKLSEKFTQFNPFTIRVFYMERGGCYSNCRMEFNLTLFKDIEFDKTEDNKNNAAIGGTNGNADTINNPGSRGCLYFNVASIDGN